MGGNGLHHLLGQILNEDQGGDKHIGCGHIGAEVGVILGIPEFFNQVAAQLDRQGTVLVVEGGGCLGEGVLVLGLQHQIDGLHHGAAVHVCGADSAVGGADLREHRRRLGNWTKAYEALSPDAGLAHRLCSNG